MNAKVPDKSKNRGAALLLALAMLTILSMLGAAWVLSLQTDTELAGLRLMKVRAVHAAGAGAQYALGELMRAADPAAAVGRRRYEVGVYGPVRTASRTLETTARLAGVKAFAQVAVEQVSPVDYPADAGGAIVAAGITPGEGRLFRITSDGIVGRTAGGREYHRTAVRTVALVLLRLDGPKFVYWNSGPAPAGAAGAK